MKSSKENIKQRILTFARMKGPEHPVSTSEVARDLFSGVWKNHLDNVRTSAGEFQKEHLTTLARVGKKIKMETTGKKSHLKLVKQPLEK
jgi:hypothetical protein